MVVHVDPDAQTQPARLVPPRPVVNIPGRRRGADQRGVQRRAAEGHRHAQGELRHRRSTTTSRSTSSAFQRHRRRDREDPGVLPGPARDEKTGLNITIARLRRARRQPGARVRAARHLEYYSTRPASGTTPTRTPDLDRITRQQNFIRRLAGLAVQQEPASNPLTANEIADAIVPRPEDRRGPDARTTSSGSSTRSGRSTRTTTSAIEMLTLPSKEGPDQKGQSVLSRRSPTPTRVLARLRDFSRRHGDERRDRRSRRRCRCGCSTASDVDGAAAAALARFAELSFAPGGAAQRPRGTVEQTEIRYRPGARQGEAGVPLPSTPTRASSRTRPQACRCRGRRRPELRVGGGTVGGTCADDDRPSARGTGADHSPVDIDTVDLRVGQWPRIDADLGAHREQGRDAGTHLEREPARYAGAEDAPVLTTSGDER